MKRTKVFTLVMAIFWTVVAVLAVILVSRMELSASWVIIFAFLAFVTVVGNWLRYFRSK
ncbi:MAG: hypothetical protein K6C12_07175 [Oscillospiraceae bacterium]|nr:hypothetical protein [Oscillospiraceae bacterium]